MIAIYFRSFNMQFTTTFFVFGIGEMNYGDMVCTKPILT